MTNLFQCLYVREVVSFAPAIDFHVKGEFPFSKLPNGIQFFDYNIGNLKKLPDYRTFDYTDIYYFSCYAHPLTQDLPKWDGSKNNITTLMLSQNSLTGTIDESYCSVILIVYSNLLTGWKIAFSFILNNKNAIHSLNKEKKRQKEIN
ncbi:hypothetical protein DICPUDRAFT_74842 [Dictyostelium purpureum]|uniref:EGF-like domain-containing protein n=1 Tax=Dictyostelium purpureum TaxID=5786 RepID=F0Z8W7_DICPU|nr:uncharacterized protein DICPUDRAFT_74842 [Dictyostelium purpureum]EGC39649.1 hypothetical protein DICPUDRAFT_74842 [Dictyostelium purpureum]|eukprot:XP_003283870.1 hypothetical protein DICPUDRAFT_74842 [Dictyostelium purpureum]